MLRAARGQIAARDPSPQMIVVTGGKGGVGATTLATNLAIALAQQALRVVLVDADLQRPDVAAHCRLQERHTVGDVLAGRLDIHEALERGPGGIQVLAGAWGVSPRPVYSEFSQRRLIDQLKGLGKHADAVVIDSGSASDGFLSEFWRAADQILLVSIADPIAVMDAYATLKLTVAEAGAQDKVYAWMNCCDKPAAAEALGRLRTSCERFLGFAPGACEPIPLDDAVPQAAQRGGLLLLEFPEAPAARAIEVGAALLCHHHRRGAELERAA